MSSFSGPRVPIRGGLTDSKALPKAFIADPGEQPHSCHVRDSMVPDRVHAAVSLRVSNAGVGYVSA